MSKFTKDNPLISIIIVNYNGKKWLDVSLPSINELNYKNIEIIVVDNNSAPEELIALQKDYPHVKVVTRTSNEGFGRANNAGVSACHGDYVFLLNNDTKFVQANFFEMMIKNMLEANYDICSPRLYNFDDIDLTNGKYVGVDVFGYPGISSNPFYIEGCSLFLKKEVFNTLAGFDPTFFMYGEDIDLGWRARIFGYKLGICEEARLWHYGGGTSQSTSKKAKASYKMPLFRRYESEKNGLRMLLKNYSLGLLIFALPIRIVLIMAEALYFLLKNNSSSAIKMLQAIVWNIFNIKDTLVQRAFVQSHRKVSDLALLKLMTLRFNKLVSFFSIGKVEVV